MNIVLIKRYVTTLSVCYAPICLVVMFTLEFGEINRYFKLFIGHFNKMSHSRTFP